MSLQRDHNREQAEAAVAEACDIIRRHSRHFVVYVRVAPFHYARHIGGDTFNERVNLAHGVAGDLSTYVLNIAQVAADLGDGADELGP